MDEEQPIPYIPDSVVWGLIVAFIAIDGLAVWAVCHWLCGKP